MSSRKRPGEADDFRPSPKRIRLFPSRAGETSFALRVLRDLEERARPYIDPEVIDLTADSPEPEVIIISDDDSNLRKRPGEADDFRPSPKRIRLFPSRAGETSFALRVLRDLEERARPYIDPEVIDLTADSPEPEVIIISDDDSNLDGEQNQQQPQVSRASDNSPEQLARNDVEEPRDIDETQLLSPYFPSIHSDEESEDGEQNQQQPQLSSSSDNSPERLARNDAEERRDFDDFWINEFDYPYWMDDDSEDGEQNQRQPQLSSSSDNSPERLARNDAEEPRDNDGWPDSAYVARYWMHYYSEWWYLRRQPHFIRTEDDSAVLVMGYNEEEQGDDDDDDARAARPASPATSDDDNSEFLEVREQPSRNVTLNRHEQAGSSGIGRRANAVPVAGPAPAELESDDEGSTSSDSIPSSSQEEGVVIKCPICYEFYSEIMAKGRNLMSTLCGHVFCSRCLPIALLNAEMCPTCRMIIDPGEYHLIYL